MMTSLIKKDFKLAKWMVLIALIACIPVTVIITLLPLEFDLIITYLLFIFVFLFNFILNQHDAKNKSDALLNSFQITRGTIVGARYISLSLFTLLVCLLLTLPSLLIHFIGYTEVLHFSLVRVMGTISTLGIVFAFYLPLYYRLGPEKIRVLNLAIYMAVILIPTLNFDFEKLSNSKWFHYFTYILNTGNSFLLMLLAGICITISYMLSVKFYKQMEF